MAPGDRAMVPDAAWPGSDKWPWSTATAPGPVGRPGRPGVSNQWGVGSFLSLGRPTCARCPGPLGSCSAVCSRGLLCCVCGVLGHFAPVHRCARSVWCVACAVSWATWILFTGAPVPCVALRARCPPSLGFCSLVCLLCLLFCLCGVLGHFALTLRCARTVCCSVSAVSWATWLLITGFPAQCVVLRVRCPRPLGPRSPVCPLGVWCCVCGVLGHLAPVHWCARSVCCFACAVSRDTWLLFTSVPALSFVLFVRCPGPLGSCSPVCLLGSRRAIKHNTKRNSSTHHKKRTRARRHHTQGHRARTGEGAANNSNTATKRTTKHSAGGHTTAQKRPRPARQSTRDSGTTHAKTRQHHSTTERSRATHQTAGHKSGPAQRTTHKGQQ